MEGFHSEKVPQNDQHLPKALARLLQIYPRNLSHSRNGIGGRLKALPKVPFLPLAEFGSGVTRSRSCEPLGKASRAGAWGLPGIQRALREQGDPWKRSRKQQQGTPRPCPVSGTQEHKGTVQNRGCPAQPDSRAGFGELGEGRAGEGHSRALILRMGVQGGTQAQHFAPGPSWFLPLGKSAPRRGSRNAARRNS